MCRTVNYPHPVIADRIQKIFRDNKLKDADVAAAVHCNRNTILAIRHAETNPSIKLLRYLCSAYHVDANWLLNLDDGGDDRK